MGLVCLFDSMLLWNVFLLFLRHGHTSTISLSFPDDTARTRPLSVATTEQVGEGETGNPQGAVRKDA